MKTIKPVAEKAPKAPAKKTAVKATPETTVAGSSTTETPAPEAKAPKAVKAKAEKAPKAEAPKAVTPLPSVTSVSVLRVLGAEDGKESKAVKKIVVVPEVKTAGGDLDRSAMRAYLEAVFGPEVAKAARWYPIATAKREDVAVGVKTGDPSARPGFLVNRGMIEDRLPGLGIENPKSTMTVVVA